MENRNMDFGFGTPEPTEDTTPVQESYDAGSSGYKDLFDGKFNSFDPANVASGNNSLKSGQFPDMIEDGPNAIGYKNNPPGFDPKPGKFFD